MDVGAKFKSYQEFLDTLNKHQAEQNVMFWKRSSRRLEKSKLKRSLNKDIVFYELHFECVHSGVRRFRGKGIRKTNSQRNECPAYIKVRADMTGQFLEIKSINLKHENHRYSKELLSKQMNQKTVEFDELLEYTETKDPRNIKVRKKNRKHFKEVVTNIRHRAQVSIFERRHVFKALFFTTENMKQNMMAWPEFLAIDGNYKVIQNSCSVYIFLIDDPNGQSRIVGVGISACDDAFIFHWLIQTFKNHHQEYVCQRVKSITTGIDLTHTRVLKTEFPGLPSYICLFNTLEIFNQDITPDKRSITELEAETSLEYLTKLVHAKNLADYQNLYEEFKKLAPSSVAEYFNQTWHPIRDQWLLCLMAYNVKNNSSNRQSIKDKVKQLANQSSSFIDFIYSFFGWIDGPDYEYATLPTIKTLEDIVGNKYQHILTDFSFKYVLKQLNLRKFVYILEQLDVDSFLIKSTEGNVETTPIKCQCKDWISMGLPCRHIFVVREKIQLELFSRELCTERWIRNDYIPSSEEILSSEDSNVDSKPKDMTSCGKLKNVMATTSELVSLVTCSSDDLYSYRMSVLQSILDKWKAGKEVTVEEVNFSSMNSQEEPSSSDVNLSSLDSNILNVEVLKEEPIKIESTPTNSPNSYDSETSDGTFINDSGDPSNVTEFSMLSRPTTDATESDTQHTTTIREIELFEDTVIPFLIQKRSCPTDDDASFSGIKKEKKYI